MTKSISRSQVRLIASTNAIFGADEACAMLRISRDAMYRLAKDPDDPFLIRMPPYLAALKHEKQVAKSQVKGSKTAKKMPPSQHGNGGQIIVFTHRHRWWLCRESHTKRNSAAQCGTQKCRSKPYRLIPTRWLQFCRPVTPVAPSFRCRLEPSAAR